MTNRSNALFIATKDDILAWIDIQSRPNQRPIEGLGVMQGHYNYIGPMKDLPEHIEYLVTWGKSDLWPWKKHINVQELCRRVFPGIGMDYRRYGNARIDAYNECQHCKEMLKRCISEKRLQDFDEILVLLGEVRL